MKATSRLRGQYRAFGQTTHLQTSSCIHQNAQPPKYTNERTFYLDLPRSQARILLVWPLSGALPPLSRCRIEKLRDLKIAAAAFLTPFRLDQDDDDDDSWGLDSTGRAAAPTTSLCSSTAAMPTALVAAAAFKSSRANSSTASFTSAQRRPRPCQALQNQRSGAWSRSSQLLVVFFGRHSDCLMR